MWSCYLPRQATVLVSVHLRGGDTGPGATARPQLNLELGVGVPGPQEDCVQPQNCGLCTDLSCPALSQLPSLQLWGLGIMTLLLGLQICITGIRTIVLASWGDGEGNRLTRL